MTRCCISAERRIEGLQCKVNLIPMNPDPVFEQVLRPPEWPVVRDFQRELLSQGVRCSVRRPKGDDIAAACGQLRAAGRKPRGFPLPEIPAGGRSDLSGKGDQADRRG